MLYNFVLSSTYYLVTFLYEVISIGVTHMFPRDFDVLIWKIGWEDYMNICALISASKGTVGVQVVGKISIYLSLNT